MGICYVLQNLLNMITGRIPLQHAEQFILSGSAYFFFHNSCTNNKERYYVKEKSDSLYYVYAYSNREYLGHIKFRKFYPAKSVSGRSIEAFEWVWERITRLILPPIIHVYHEGRCGVCGRPLRDPESVLRGIGPKCREGLIIKSQ